MRIIIPRKEIKNTISFCLSKIDGRIDKINALWLQTIKIVLTLSTTLLFGSIPLFRFFVEERKMEGEAFWFAGWLCLLSSIVLLIWGLIEQERHSAMILNKDQEHIKILNDAFVTGAENADVEVGGIVLYMNLFFSIIGINLFFWGLACLMLGVVAASFLDYFLYTKIGVLVLFGFFSLWTIFSFVRFQKAYKKGLF